MCSLASSSSSSSSTSVVGAKSDPNGEAAWEGPDVSGSSERNDDGGGSDMDLHHCHVKLMGSESPDNLDWEKRRESFCEDLHLRHAKLMVSPTTGSLSLLPPMSSAQAGSPGSDLKPSGLTTVSGVADEWLQRQPASISPSSWLDKGVQMLQDELVRSTSHICSLISHVFFFCLTFSHIYFHLI